MKIFFAIVTFILLIIWTAVWFTLIEPLELNSTYRFICLAIFVISFSLQIFRFVQFKKGDLNPRLVLLTFSLFGVFVHLFCAAITKEIILLIPGLNISEFHLSAAVIGLAVAFNFLGIYTAMRGPQVVSQKIQVGEKFKQLEGLKIVQISDLHIGPLIKEKYVKNVAQTISRLEPDIVVYTGDIGDGDARYFAHELNHFQSLSPNLGQYFVTGNHENMWGAKSWMDAITANGIIVLNNSGVQLLPQLFLAGVPDISSARFGEFNSNPFEAIKNAQGFKVLLAHQPKSCFDAEKAGFDLMLSGHTHNGQFFPFNLLVGFFNPYSKGLNRHGALQVYVNSGTGFWGPPLRLAVKSEITFIQLVV